MANQVKNGTAVYCEMAGGHFKAGTVCDFVRGNYSTHYLIRVTVESTEGAVERFDRAGNIGAESMKGIGWKIATAENMRVAKMYAED